MNNRFNNSPRLRPMISVVLPVRNGLPYLPAAVNSILDQTYENFELITIDDGSTDDTRDWLAARAVQDDRLRLVDNPGSGLVDALNHGLIESKGVYVARMDADDIAMPRRFERQVNFLEANPSVAVLGTQVLPINAQGDPVGKATAFPTAPASIANALLKKGCVFRHPTIMARREALESMGGYRAALTYAEDFDLWLRMAERFELANLTEVTLFYRVHQQSISNARHMEQQLAHSLALLSAQRRRRGLSDPIETETQARWEAHAHDAEVSSLLRGHSALKAFASGSRSAAISRLILDAIEIGLLCHSRRRLVEVLSEVTHYATISRDLNTAWRGAKLSMKVDFKRTQKGLCLSHEARLPAARPAHEM